MTANCLNYKRFLPFVERIAFLVFVCFLFFFIFQTQIFAAINQTINFQSKIVVKSNGLNLTTGTPACIIAGAGNDTCDFQVRIWNHQTGADETPGSGNLMFTQTFQDVEIGELSGIFNLSINSCGSAQSGNSEWGTNVGTCAVIDDSDTDSDPGVNFDRDDLWLEIGFAPADTAGSLGTFSELFSRTQFKSVPSAFHAQTASSIDGLAVGNLVQLAPSSVQTTGDTTNPLIYLNENGTGTPNLLQLQTGGVDSLVLTNAGQLQLPVTGITGGILLGGDVQLYRSGANELTIPDLTKVAGLQPTVDNTYSFGASSARWLDSSFGPGGLNIYSPAGTGGIGTDYTLANLGFSGTTLNITTTNAGANTGGQINLTSAYPAGNTTNSAFNVVSSDNLAAADELFQVGDSGGDLFTVYGGGNATLAGSLALGGAANDVLGISAAAGAATNSLYWGDDKICLENGTNCPPSGSSTVSLTNRSGGTLNSGALVVMDPANDDSFTTTTTPYDPSVIGVLVTDGCADDAVCDVQIGGVVAVDSSMAVWAGDNMYTSTTAGQALTETTTTNTGIIGIALSSDFVPPYSVNMLIVKDMTTGAGGGMFTNTDTVDNGDYLEIQHNQNTDDIIATGWVYNESEEKWEVANTAEDLVEQSVGTGADGALAPSGTFNLNTSTSGVRSYADGIAYRINAPDVGANSVTRYSGSVTLSNGLAPGDEVLVINLQGASGDYADVGNYEFRIIDSVDASTVTFTTELTTSFDGTTAANQKVVIQRVPNYTSVTLDSTDALNASAWDGLTTTPTGAAGYYTGIVVFRATGTVTVGASAGLGVGTLGYRGGAGHVGVGPGYQGEGIAGLGAQGVTTANVDGGGSGYWQSAGGGGGHYTYGTAGSVPGYGGLAKSVVNNKKLYFGGGGGGGSSGGATSYAGGAGGGIVYISASAISVSNYITAAGGNGNGAGGSTGGSGGGAGGSMTLFASDIDILGYVYNAGGAGGTSNTNGGPGGVGKTSINYLNSFRGTNTAGVTGLLVEQIKAAYDILQVDADTVRLYNYSGSTQELKLVVTTVGGSGGGGGSGTLQLEPVTPDVSVQNNVAAIHVNKTGEGGNTLELEDDGADVFTVGVTGSTTIGNSTADDVDLTVYGDILQGSNKDLYSQITNISDIFIYDTAADADGGAWTNSTAAQGASWYTEVPDDGAGDLCDIATDDRCGKGEFPKKAIIISAANDVYIFNAMNNLLWMKFSQGTSYALGAAVNNNPSSVSALNGSLYVGLNGSSGIGMVEIDFKNDRVFLYDTTDRSQSDLTVSGRNSANTYNTNNLTSAAIIGNIVNDISVARVEGKDYIALATNNGLSVVNKVDLATRNYIRDSDAADDVDITKVVMLNSGDTYAAWTDLTDTTYQELLVYYAIHTKASETSYAQNVSGIYYVQRELGSWGTGGPVILGTANTDTIDSLEVKDGKILVGTSAGLTVLSEKRGDEANGTVKYYTNTYTSEEMLGAVKGMWTMYEGTGTTLDDISIRNGNSNAFTGTPTWRDGVRNYALDFDRGTDEVTVPDSDNFTLSSNFSLSVWINPDNIADNWKEFLGTYNGSNGWIFALDNASTNELEFYDGTWRDSNVAIAEDGQWKHVAMVNDAGNCKFYLNGEYKAVVACGTSSRDGGYLSIGAGGPAAGTATYGFDGRIDEVLITGDVLSDADIKKMYLQGKSALENRTITVVDATTVSSTTIGDSAETWTPSEFVGGVVEITGGTGVGQTRKITANTATTLTVSPAWSVTPSTDSDFAIRPEQLYGASNVVTSAKVVNRDNQRLMYVGTSNGSDGGGVTAIDLASDRVMDVYQGLAGKTDDAATSWDTTTDYDDIQAIAVDDKITAIGSLGLYWEEFGGESLIDKINQVDQKENASTALTDVSRQNVTTNTPVQNQYVLKGWSYVVGSGSGAYTARGIISFNITFSDIPILSVSSVGTKVTTAPASLVECTGEAYNLTPSMSTPTTSSVQVRFGDINGNVVASSTYVCYTWIAIGTYSGNGGADLAENYLTYDLGLEAGDVVGIDSHNDISVARTRSAYDQSTIGVVATRPSIVIGPADGTTPGVDTSITGNEVVSGEGKTVPVALAGRVPVKVTLENGPIKRGDFLVASSTPGYAMKATRAGLAIGRALENFDGSQTIVNTDTELAEMDKLIEMGELELGTTQATEAASADQEIAMTGMARKVLFADMRVSSKADKSVTGKVMTFVQPGYYWGEVGGVEQVEVASTAGVTETPVELADLPVQIVSAGAETSLATDMTKDIKLAENKVEVKGAYNLSEVLLDQEAGSIDSIGKPLRMQSSSTTNIEMFNGKMIFDSTGKLVISGEIKVDKITVPTITLTQDGGYHGQATIPAGESGVRLDLPFSDKQYLVMATPLAEGYRFGVSKAIDYFEIRISEPAVTPVSFDYLVFLVE